MASTNLPQYRAIREKDRRDKISIGHHLKKLVDIQRQIDVLLVEQRRELFNAEGEPVEISSDVPNGRIGALRLSADISLRLLNKRMPDLKAIEVKGKIEHTHAEMSRIEMDGVLIQAGIEPETTFKRLKSVDG